MNFMFCESCQALLSIAGQATQMRMSGKVWRKRSKPGKSPMMPLPLGLVSKGFVMDSDRCTMDMQRWDILTLVYSSCHDMSIENAMNLHNQISKPKSDRSL